MYKLELPESIKIKFSIEKLKLRLLKFIERILIFISIVLPSVTLMSLMKYYFLLPELLYFFVLFLFFVLTVYLFYPIFQKFDDDKIALYLQKKYPFLKDNLINAVELTKAYNNNEEYTKYISSELSESFLKHVEDNLIKNFSKENQKKFDDLRKPILTSILAILLFIYYFSPFTKFLFSPSLKFKEVKKKEITQKIYPEIGNFEFMVFYPSYTKLKSKEFEKYSTHINALINSDIMFRAYSNKELSKAFLVMPLQGKIPVNVINKKIEGKFKAIDGIYEIIVEDKESLKNLEQFKFSVSTIPDENPSITILSPPSSITTYPRSKVKIIYDAKDDFGINEINIIITKLNNEILKKINIKNHTGSYNHEISDYELDIGGFNLSDGDKIIFYMEIFDNDEINGPKRAESTKCTIEIQGIERKSQELTDISSKDNLQEIIEMSKDLLSKNSKILEDLEALKENISSEKLSELRGNLELLSSYWKQFKENLDRLAMEVPADYLDKESIKNLNLDEISKLLSELRRKLEEGNFTEASEISAKLNKMLANLLSSMENSGMIGKFRESYLLARKLGPKSDELENIINAESSIIESTYTLSNKINEFRTKEQEKLLLELAKKQLAIIEESKKLSSDTHKKVKEEPALQGFYTIFDPCIQIMQFVYNELANLQVRDSSNQLTKIIQIISNSYNILPNITKKYEEIKDEIEKKNKEDEIKTIAIKIDDIKKKEQEIVDVLSGRINLTPTLVEKENSHTIKLANKQKDVYFRTEKLNNELKELEKKTGLNSSITKNLNTASENMINAENEILKIELNKALAYEQDTLEYLIKCKENLDELLAKLQSFEQNVAKGLNIIKPVNTPGGKLGALNGYVKLPGIKEYQAPKEFREDIIEAIKEKFPPAYRKLIEEYYKKLIE